MKQKLLTKQEISIFCRQIYMLLHSGITVIDSLDIMIDDMEQNEGVEILSKIKEYMDNGEPFSVAVTESGYFPKYVADMILLGETTGDLDNVLNNLAEYYDREYQIESSIKSALKYPTIMIILMLCVVYVILTKVMPVFNDVFIQLGSEITGFSAGIMNFGLAISKYKWVFIGILAALFVVVYILRHTKGGRNTMHKLNQKSIFTRKISEKIAVSRFANTLYMMFSNGIDTAQCFDTALQLIDNENVEKKVKACKEQVETGEPLSTAIIGSNIFSPMHNRILSVGFKTGNSDNAMEQIAREYADEINDEIESKVSLIEPTLVAIFSVIVGIILLSVMLPLLSTMLIL